MFAHAFASGKQISIRSGRLATSIWPKSRIRLFLPPGAGHRLHRSPDERARPYPWNAGMLRSASGAASSVNAGNLIRNECRTVRDASLLRSPLHSMFDARTFGSIFARNSHCAYTCAKLEKASQWADRQSTISRLGLSPTTGPIPFLSRARRYGSWRAGSAMCLMRFLVRECPPLSEHALRRTVRIQRSVGRTSLDRKAQIRYNQSWHLRSVHAGSNL